MYKVGSISVTKEIAHVGMKVGRGKHWIYGPQDCTNSTADPRTKQVHGIITNVGENVATVDWQCGSIKKGYVYSIGHKTLDLSVWEWDSDFLIEEETPVLKDPPGYKRLTGVDIVEIGDKVIGMTDDPSNRIYYHKETKIEPGKVYTVERTGSSGNGEPAIQVTGSTYKYWVGIRAFAMYEKVTPPKPNTDSLGYLQNTTGLMIGDKLVFSQHLGDSDNADLIIGEETRIGLITGSGMIHTTKKYWNIDIRCFKLPQPYTLLDNASKVEIGDKLILRKSNSNSSYAKITIGEEVTVVGKELTSGYWVKTSKDPGWAIEANLFSFSRKGEKKEPDYLYTTRGLEVGDKLILKKHHEDSWNSNIAIDQEVTITKVDHVNNWVDTNMKSDWVVPIRCFIFSKKADRVAEVREKMEATSGYVMTPSGPKKASSISSNNKTDSHDKHKSVTFNRRSSGSAVKIQGTHPKIREGQIGRRSPVCSRSGGIKVEW